MDDQRVILETHKNVQNLTILSASGINGAEVSEFSELSLGDISNGEMKEVSLNVSYPEEQSFVILRVSYTIGGNDIDEILTISIGELSQGQKRKEKKENQDPIERGQSSLVYPINSPGNYPDTYLWHGNIKDQII